jgi:hypothetical protein
MAFSLAEKTRIRMYLGWATRYLQSETRLESAMVALDPEAEQVVREQLGQCASVDNKLLEAESRFAAKEVGSISLPGGDEMSFLRSRGRQAVGRLAAILGVEVRHDVFAGAGPTNAAGYGGMYEPQGTSNVIRHG